MKLQARGSGQRGLVERAKSLKSKSYTRLGFLGCKLAGLGPRGIATPWGKMVSSSPYSWSVAETSKKVKAFIMTGSYQPNNVEGYLLAHGLNLLDSSIAS